MNCHDFERIWNELFDAGSSLPGEEHASAAGENELALLEHATGCTTVSPPGCRLSGPSPGDSRLGEAAGSAPGIGRSSARSRQGTAAGLASDGPKTAIGELENGC